MKKQRWEESEKSSEEARRSEKRKNQKKEDAGALGKSRVIVPNDLSLRSVEK